MYKKAALKPNSILAILVIIIAGIGVSIFWSQKKSSHASPVSEPMGQTIPAGTSTVETSEPEAISTHTPLAVSPNATDADLTRGFISYIYNSTDFIPDSPGAGVPKNQLLWKPDQAEFSDAFPIENPGKPISASPVLLYKFTDQGTAYAYFFTQSPVFGTSHASGVAVGAGIFKIVNGKWHAEYISRNIEGVLGAFGNAGSFVPIKIGLHTYAFQYSFEDMHFGNMDGFENLIYFNGKEIVPVLELRTKGDDGTNYAQAGCTNSADSESGLLPWEEKITFVPRPGINPDYYDLAAEWGGTQLKKLPSGLCRIEPLSRTESYHWDGQGYTVTKS